MQARNKNENEKPLAYKLCYYRDRTNICHQKNAKLAKAVEKYNVKNTKENCKYHTGI